MRFLALTLLLAFSFQVMDIPLMRNTQKSPTCCGRTVCLCKHGKGALCPLKNGHKKKSTQTLSAHKHCHLPKAKQLNSAARDESSKMPKGGIWFSKAPCASDTSTSVLPQYAKDYLFVNSSELFSLDEQSHLHRLPLPVMPTVRVHGIFHPPRSIFFSF